MIIPRQAPPLSFRNCDCLRLFLFSRCLLIIGVIRYIRRLIWVIFCIKLEQNNAIDRRNQFQEIRCERQDLQAHIY